MNCRSRVVAAVLTLAIAVCLTACGDDKTTETDGGGGSGGEPSAPVFTTHTVDLPQAMMESSDPMAQTAVSQVALANAISGYSTYLYPPAGTQGVSGTGTWTYTWATDSLTVTLVITDTGNLYQWEAFFDGTLGGQTFDNWKAIHAEAAKDGSGGEFIYYQPVTTEVLMSWTWSTDTQGVFTFVMFYYGGMGGGKVEITVNPDGSGSLAVYEGDGAVYELTLLVEWEADGSGQWWTYEGGSQTDSGFWY